MTEKGKFLKSFNEAFANGDIKTVLDAMTDDVEWVIVGDKTILGKAAVQSELQQMMPKAPLKISLAQIITHGKEAAVSGKIKMKDESLYAFCDTYEFSGFKNPKIKKMVSFVIKVDQTA
ncbi:nuclear transport factor 2 family protein [Echinicola sp. CAU 1574]|uniref:Nuclear transport factor 2 family protein n=1 Tax=Echinicola arenosa TaxID=2774144 RepID=A0ABR9ALZ7_9BACT|nr:nuclear transport factor 2 family protein [Echinicola arenosa]MBD8488644.1 nuclear transport factor 2 family protein [Echinicola arenosa]